MYPMYKIKLHDHRHSKRLSIRPINTLSFSLSRSEFLFVSSRSFHHGSKDRRGWRRVRRRRRSKEKSTREGRGETISPFALSILHPSSSTVAAIGRRERRRFAFIFFSLFFKSLSLSLSLSHSLILFNSLIILASSPRKHAAAFLRDESFAKNETGKRVTINCTGTIVRSLYGSWRVDLVHLLFENKNLGGRRRWREWGKIEYRFFYFLVRKKMWVGWWLFLSFFFWFWENE